jgi:hypothetical protein
MIKFSGNDAGLLIRRSDAKPGKLLALKWLFQRKIPFSTQELAIDIL